MKHNQRKQVLVKLTNSKEGKEFIDYLENNGFINIHNISFDSLRVKVIVVDTDKFWSTNITCLAAVASCGIKPISIEEFKNIIDLKNQNL